MVWGSGNLSCFLQAEPLGRTLSSAELFLRGADATGCFAAASFYTVAGIGGNVPTGVLPLFIGGPDSAAKTANLNAFVAGEYCRSQGSFDLCLFNAESGTSSSLGLYMRGSGLSEGANPFNAFLGLFLGRPTAGATTFFLAAPGTPASGDFSLFLPGVGGAESGVNLATPNVLGWTTDTMTFHTRGW